MSIKLPAWAAHGAGLMMGSMLLLGTAFAAGHHFFYQSLSGKRPPSTIYLSGFAGGLTGQQVNLTVGSIFAFFAKACFGVAITTAADQALWTTLRKKSLKLGAVDNLATATTNVWSMFDVRLWRKSLIRMISATIYWLLFITSVITPATLNVRWSVATSTLKTRVLQVDFTSLNFAHMESLSGDPSKIFTYSSPTFPVLQAVAASTTGGFILPISSPHENATWLLEFPGPALSCERMDNNSALYKDIATNILTAMISDDGELCMRSFGYISWVPTNPHGNLSYLPFPSISINQYEPPSTNSLGPMIDILVVPADEVLTLYIAALPGMNQWGDPVGCAHSDNGSISFGSFALGQVADMTVTTCTLYNTSYMANFTYINGVQNVELSTKGSFNNVTGLASFESPDGGTEIAVSVKGVENVAYQAVMDAFGRMFVGTISNESPMGGIGAQVIDSQVTSTPLLGTADYNFLQSFGKSVDSLQSFLVQHPTDWNGLSVQQESISTLSTARVIEELFRNATISLMSMPLLQPNYSSPYAPPETVITLTAYNFIYSYAAQTLWLAYGITLLMTLLSILLGGVSIYRNGGSSYTTKFSSILRIAHGINMSEAVRPEDTDGKDPTPQYIKKMTIFFPPGNTVRYEAAKVVEEDDPQRGESA
ncbi:hypothetical protein V8C35DRAFT_313766 [Trichoderma chlorosporum]